MRALFGAFDDAARRVPRFVHRPAGALAGDAQRWGACMSLSLSLAAAVAMGDATSRRRETAFLFFNGLSNINTRKIQKGNILAIDLFSFRVSRPLTQSPCLLEPRPQTMRVRKWLW